MLPFLHTGEAADASSITQAGDEDRSGEGMIMMVVDGEMDSDFFSGGGPGAEVPLGLPGEVLGVASVMDSLLAAIFGAGGAGDADGGDGSSQNTVGQGGDRDWGVEGEGMGVVRGSRGGSLGKGRRVGGREAGLLFGRTGQDQIFSPQCFFRRC